MVRIGEIDADYVERTSSYSSFRFIEYKNRMNRIYLIEFVFLSLSKQDRSLGAKQSTLNSRVYPRDKFCEEATRQTRIVNFCQRREHLFRGSHAIRSRRGRNIDSRPFQKQIIVNYH